jgi:two-component system nitrate/nitrite response regulator NarL
VLAARLQSNQHRGVDLARKLQFHETSMVNTSAPIRVLLADSHALFREGLRLLLEADANICVVGETGDGEEAVELTRRLEPDVMLLDLKISPCSGIETLKVIQKLALPVRVLMLAIEEEEVQIGTLLRTGAFGLIMKESTSTLLRKGIRAVMEGQYWIARGSISDLVRELMKENKQAIKGPTSAKWELTFREEQIVAEIVSGSTNKQIAKDLDLSEQTVKHHLTSIFDKVGASSRLELALMVHHFSMTHQDSHLIGEEDKVMQNPLHKQEGKIASPTTALANPSIPKSSKACA